MADNEYTLFKWLQEKGRTFSWDLVVAMDRARTNHLLEQDYVRRFAEDSYLPSFSAAVKVGDYVEFYLHDFLLDRPRLSFENAELNDSVARLSLVIISGSEVQLEVKAGGYGVVRLERITPLQGPVLTLDLQLPDAPVTVEQEGRLLLDLSNSDDFNLTLDPDPDKQRAGGAVFKDLFNRLPAEQRVLTLGHVSRDIDEFLKPRSMRMATQAHPPLPGRPAGEGAMLAFISMKDEHSGGVPSEGADFRYLIPDGEQEAYSATVLFGYRRQLVALMLKNLTGELSSQLHLDYDQQLLAGVTVNSKRMELPEAQVRFEMDGTFYTANLERTILQGIDEGIDIRLTAEGAEFDWPFKGAFQVSGLKREGAPGPGTGFIGAFEKRCEIAYVIDEEAPGTVSLRATRMELSDLDNGAAMKFVELSEDAIVQYLGLDAVAAAQLHARHRGTNEEWWGKVVELALMLFFGFSYLVIQQFMRLLSVAIISVMKVLIQQVLLARFTVSPQTDAWINQLIKLNLGETFVPIKVRGPFDIACFGQIASHRDAPRLIPQGPTLAADATLVFSAESPSPIETWTVEPLGDATARGRIDAQGGYTAPPASAFEGAFLRERVTATTVSGATSGVLVTVARDALAMTPLVQVCVVGREYPLSANSTQDPDRLQWRIVSPEPSGRLEGPVTGASVTYLAGASSAFYAFDYVEVSDPENGTSGQILMINTDEPHPVIVREIVGNRVTLAVEGVAADDLVHWAGPGTFEDAGHDADLHQTFVRFSPASDGDAPFVVVEARVEPTDGWAPTAGYIVLPLPLHRYADTYALLCQRP
ncbi:hypothetical protein N5D48_25045 [Pseudomonas sp. GD03858]|uniref:hypothetical protein n=1 Tax=unclassified Pseudomonas TaxID=196821 RepID=UPI00244A7C75|nr:MULTISPECIES: hypothetical protein [unclassified Pseudomonas]MDH0650028.1 hypothetical protein [Pseudomonas sp. GD03867]MDH0665676.1 hypothetical protein [Pseudomonas sp. GD03858]